MLATRSAILKSSNQTQYNSKPEELNVFRDDGRKMSQVYVFYTRPLHFYKIRTFMCKSNTVVHRVRTKHFRQHSLCKQLCTHCVLSTKVAGKLSNETQSNTDRNILISLHIWCLDRLLASFSETFVIVVIKFFITQYSAVQPTTCEVVSHGLRNCVLQPCVSYCLSST